MECIPIAFARPVSEMLLDSTSSSNTIKISAQHFSIVSFEIASMAAVMHCPDDDMKIENMAAYNIARIKPASEKCIYVMTSDSSSSWP